MPHLKVGDVQVHYREIGHGPSVVLLPGGGASGAQWKQVCNRLCDRYRLITVDHYGHGGTDVWPGPANEHTHDAEAELVRNVISHVGEPAHVVGHSYGGGVALRLALAAPGCVRSLVLLEPYALSILEHGGEAGLISDHRQATLKFIRDIQAGDCAGAWARFLEGNDAPVLWPRLPPEAQSRLLAMTDSLVLFGYAVLNHDTTPEQCRGLTLPVLLLHGAATRPMFRRITELLAGFLPAAKLHVLPAAGHMSPLTHPEAIAAALVEHFAHAS
jgi:pimeloyl-ACP methyl ester carboxylesterase